MTVWRICMRTADCTAIGVSPRAVCPDIEDFHPMTVSKKPAALSEAGAFLTKAVPMAGVPGTERVEAAGSTSEAAARLANGNPPTVRDGADQMGTERADGEGGIASLEAGASHETAAGTEEDVFAAAARARKERHLTGQRLTITRKPMSVPVVMKTKAWFRTHPEAVYTGVAIFVDPTSEEMEAKPFYVLPELAEELEGSDGLSAYTAYLICTANAKIMLFLVKEADMDGSMHTATEAKHDACRDARERWTRMTWERDAGQYQISQAGWDRRPALAR